MSNWVNSDNINPPTSPLKKGGLGGFYDLKKQSRIKQIKKPVQ